MDFNIVAASLKALTSAANRAVAAKWRFRRTTAFSTIANGRAKSRPFNVWRYTMSDSRLSPIAYVLIGIAIGGLAGACAAGADQPNMQAALGSLQQARSYLVQATPNKGGHRERAINLVNQAINETEAGMAYSGY
jgi:hypothetical protein